MSLPLEYILPTTPKKVAASSGKLYEFYFKSPDNATLGISPKEILSNLVNRTQVRYSDKGKRHDSNYGTKNIQFIRKYNYPKKKTV